MTPNTVSKSEKLIVFFKKHRKLCVGSIVIIVGLMYMALIGTLSYPYIMIDRQIQSLKDCSFGSSSFTTDKYGFSFQVPDGYCVLPNRLFPLDGSIEIIPKGFYFVFNEYAKGSIASASKATVLFEPVTQDRDPGQIIETLIKGKFLVAENVSSGVSESGINYTIANKASGTDEKLYDWVFISHPNKKYFVAIVAKHSESNEVVKRFIETVSFQ